MDVTDCKVGVRYSDLVCAASKRCVMSSKLRQVQTGTLRRVVNYLGGREPPPPSIDDTQPMEGTEAIGGAEPEGTTYLSALLPRIEQRPRASPWRKQKWVGPPGNGSSRSDANAAGAGSTSRWSRPPAARAARGWWSSNRSTEHRAAVFPSAGCSGTKANDGAMYDALAGCETKRDHALAESSRAVP